MGEYRSLCYPIGKEEARESFRADFNESLKSSLLLTIKMLRSALKNAIQNLGAGQLDTPYRPGGWTANQLVHHVADSHINAYAHFKLGPTENNPIIKPYNQNAWALLPDSNTVPLNVSLTLLHALHERWYSLMKDLPEEQWRRTIYHPGRKIEITLWELLKTYPWHGKRHMKHITNLRERM